MQISTRIVGSKALVWYASFPPVLWMEASLSLRTNYIWSSLPFNGNISLKHKDIRASEREIEATEYSVRSVAVFHIENRG